MADTVPGDVIAFDLHTWHARRGGRDRLAWTAVYQRCPETDSERNRTLRSVHDSFEQAFRGFDTGRYPIWRHWLTDAAVPTPVLLAADPAGTGAGVPALLMSRLPGRVDWWPSDTGRWLQRLAGVLPAIHAAPLPAAGLIGAFTVCPQASYQPPPWARYPQVWERAAEISRGPAPVLPEVLVHGDFHPGNVLRRWGMVSGVVDWQAACTGPAVIDVAHCRTSLLTLGTSAAQRFTAWWQQAAGGAYHPWADVVTIIGCLDDLRDDRGSGWLLVEDMLSRAVAELGEVSR